MTSYSIHITMQSDWHIGTGSGRPGSVDRLVRRDNDHLPIIPAKTLTGILRDACELVINGLDNEEPNGPWHSWLTYLFGDQPALAQSGADSETAPRPAHLSIRPAQLPSELRNLLTHKPVLKEALTFVKAGVSIDSRSGMAKTDFLRFEEMTRGGTQLFADCTIQDQTLDDSQKRTATALLVAGAAMVEHLGAKRRRGAGRCQISLPDQLSLTEAIDHLRSCLADPPSPPELTTTTAKTLTPLTATPSDTWVAFDLTLTTQTPLIMHQRVIGNHINSLDYIPGTYLIPVIAQWMRQHGLDLSQAIGQGDIVITHATPAVKGQRGFPVPLCLSGEKLQPQAVINLLETSIPLGGPQRKSLRSGYIRPSLSPSDDSQHHTWHKTIDFEIATHNTVDDKVQRPTSDIGGLYSYEAIPAGQCFRAELRLRQSLMDDRQLAALLNDEQSTYPLNLGRTKKDDYGAVKLKIQATPTPAAPPEVTDDRLTIWLLSDLLLRDDRLRPVTQPKELACILGRKLGLTLTLQNSQVSHADSFARQRRTDSWQTKWGLPRPSLVGLQAGTCLVLQITDLDPKNRSALAQQLSALEQSGLGERTAEGYGQIRFNAPLLSQSEMTIENMSRAKQTSLQQTNLAPPHSPATNNRPDLPLPLLTPNDANNGDTYAYARILEREAWRRAIAYQVLSLANTAESRKTHLGFSLEPDGKGQLKSHPTLSQLGSLRSLLAPLRHCPDLTAAANHRQEIQKWITNIRSKPAILKKWSKTQTLGKLEDLVNKPDSLWPLLLPTEIETLTIDASQDLKKELWPEALWLFLDACMRAHKRDGEASNSNSDSTNPSGGAA